jgi:hypothetical protein
MASQPITMPQKSSDYLATFDPVDYRISGSPLEAPDSGTTSGITSYDPSAASASYAASASDFDGSSGTSSIDLLEFMNERLQSSYDPTPMDTSLVQQAQASGQLNDKTRQLLELQARAQQKFAEMQASFSEGIKTARDVQKDLEWTQKKVDELNYRAAEKYPDQYSLAQGRYPTSVDY